MLDHDVLRASVAAASDSGTRATAADSAHDLLADAAAALQLLTVNGDEEEAVLQALGSPNDRSRAATCRGRERLMKR